MKSFSSSCSAANEKLFDLRSLALGWSVHIIHNFTTHVAINLTIRITIFRVK